MKTASGQDMHDSGREKATSQVALDDVALVKEDFTNEPTAPHFRTIGGGGEIRTHERLPVAGFQDRCNRPLCHTSAGLKLRCCACPDTGDT